MKEISEETLQALRRQSHAECLAHGLEWAQVFRSLKIDANPSRRPEPLDSYEVRECAQHLGVYSQEFAQLLGRAVVRADELPTAAGPRAAALLAFTRSNSASLQSAALTAIEGSSLAWTERPRQERQKHEDRLRFLQWRWFEVKLESNTYSFPAERLALWRWLCVIDLPLPQRVAAKSSPQPVLSRPRLCLMPADVHEIVPLPDACKAPQRVLHRAVLDAAFMASARAQLRQMMLALFNAMQTCFRIPPSLSFEDYLESGEVDFVSNLFDVEIWEPQHWRGNRRAESDYRNVRTRHLVQPPMVEELHLGFGQTRNTLNHLLVRNPVRLRTVPGAEVESLLATRFMPAPPPPKQKPEQGRHFTLLRLENPGAVRSQQGHVIELSVLAGAQLVERKSGRSLEKLAQWYGFDWADIPPRGGAVNPRAWLRRKLEEIGVAPRRTIPDDELTLADTLLRCRDAVGFELAGTPIVLYALVDRANNRCYLELHERDVDVAGFLLRACKAELTSAVAGFPETLVVPRILLKSHPEIQTWTSDVGVKIELPASGADAGARYAGSIKAETESFIGMREPTKGLTTFEELKSYWAERQKRPLFNPDYLYLAAITAAARG